MNENEYDNCNNRVDQISLYLSLQNQEDERIHIALDEMMQEFWKEHRGQYDSGIGKIQ